MEPRNSAASASRRKPVSSRAYAERVSSAYSSRGVRPEYALQHHFCVLMETRQTQTSLSYIQELWAAGILLNRAQNSVAASAQQQRVGRMHGSCTAGRPGSLNAR